MCLLLGSLGLVVYAFVGYPALLALLARVRPRPVAADPAFEPRVSVIVAAYNEADVIVPRLENVYQLEFPRDRLEVIVVADGSDDGTEERARTVPGTRVLHEPERRGKLAAVIRAASVATGEILVFTDANNLYTRETLRELVAPFADPAVGVVTGRKAIDAGHGRALDEAEGLYWRYESRIKEWESEIGSVSGVAGEILAFRRGAFLRPRQAMITEDFVQAMLAATQGWRVVYAPNAVSVERASATLADEATRRSRIVTGRLQALLALLPELLRRNPQLAWQVVSHKGLRPIVPAALLAAGTSSAVLAPSRPLARVLATVQAACYGAALVGWWNERRGSRNRVFYLPYYFCRMNVATVRGVRNFASGRRDAVWTKVRRG